MYVNYTHTDKAHRRCSIEYGNETVTFPGLELNTSERNEDDPSGVFITISSASRLPHFEQDLLTKEIITLGFYFAQHSMEKNRLPN